MYWEGHGGFYVVRVTHLFSLQPALGKNSAPFRLPQDHMLFGCLREAVSKGELKLAVGLEAIELGCETACVVADTCGTWLLLIRLCSARRSLDPLHGGSNKAHLPASRRGRGDMCSHPAGVHSASSGEAARV